LSFSRHPRRKLPHWLQNLAVASHEVPQIPQGMVLAGVCSWVGEPLPTMSVVLETIAANPVVTSSAPPKPSAAKACQFAAGCGWDKARAACPAAIATSSVPTVQRQNPKLHRRR